MGLQKTAKSLKPEKLHMSFPLHGRGPPSYLFFWKLINFSCTRTCALITGYWSRLPAFAAPGSALWGPYPFKLCDLDAYRDPNRRHQPPEPLAQTFDPGTATWGGLLSGDNAKTAGRRSLHMQARHCGCEGGGL